MCFMCVKCVMCVYVCFMCVENFLRMDIFHEISLKFQFDKLGHDSVCQFVKNGIFLIKKISKSKGGEGHTLRTDTTLP